MWRSVSRFAILPPLDGGKWRETCSFNSALVTSFIKSLTRSAPVKNSALRSRALLLGILPSFSQTSRRLPWTPKPEETSVKSFEGKLTNKAEPLLWSATIHDGRDSRTAQSLSAMAGSKKRLLFHEGVRTFGQIEGGEGAEALQPMGPGWLCDLVDRRRGGFLRDLQE